MRKRQYLVEAIDLMALRPRYVEERIEYLHIDGTPTLTFPMTCFCDIPLSKADEHMKVYGSYGIALKKSRCLTKDVQPITYLNPNGRLAQDLSDAVRKLLQSSEHIDDKWRFLPDVAMGFLLYAKPIVGSMRRKAEMIDNQLFIDECEWRHIPAIPDGMMLTMNPQDSTDEGRKAYSAALARHRETWFSFGVDDVEHIIVPDESEALGVMRAIEGMDGKDEVLKHKLMTKIEIADKIRLNFV